MTKSRLEAFTDGVIAVIITIMVLEMRAPKGTALRELWAILPAFLCYVLSFIYVGIYWNNHHHLFKLVDHVSGGTLWANLHLLFWLSLIPFATSWMGENHIARWPVVVYGIVLFMNAVAWEILRRVLLRHHAPGSTLAHAMGNKWSLKEWTSLVLYAAAIGLAFINSWLSCGIFALVAAVWFVPDRRVEREVNASHHGLKQSVEYHKQQADD